MFSFIDLRYRESFEEHLMIDFEYLNNETHFQSYFKVKTYI